ncbi:MAG: hypothetical protein ACLPN1_07785 [Dissulfurispiraceae bacterium]|jgi:hypothetical protein
MGTTCKECGAAFQSKPFPVCPYCGNADIAIEADISPDAHEEKYKMLRHILEDLCERVYNGSSSVEFRNIEIERAMERMKLLIMLVNNGVDVWTHREVPKAWQSD